MAKKAELLEKAAELKLEVSEKNTIAEIEAAIAYNKACDMIAKKMPDKKYRQNYIDTLSPSQYAELYTRLPVSKKLLDYMPL